MKSNASLQESHSFTSPRQLGQLSTWRHNFSHSAHILPITSISSSTLTPFKQRDFQVRVLDCYCDAFLVDVPQEELLLQSRTPEHLHTRIAYDKVIDHRGLVILRFWSSHFLLNLIDLKHPCDTPRENSFPHNGHVAVRGRVVPLTLNRGPGAC